MSAHYLAPLFAPRSVAVIGASVRPGSLGHAVLANLRTGGFTGGLFAVNPKYDLIDGLPCYRNLALLPQAPDLALIVTPASTVSGVLEQAARTGTKHAVVLSAGFGETGPDGHAREEEVRRTARTNGLRMIGPNCLGIMRPAIGLNATFARGTARAGSIALVSQSGAMCAALADWAWSAGIGFSSVISLGAAADLDFGEVLDYLLHDDETKSILLYVEGVHDARRFISGLRAAARTKPIVVLKAGRHAAGAHAALSHTGAITGDDAVFDAALRRSGVVRAQTWDELFAAARLLGAGRLPAGKRLAILTNGGGPGVMAADCAIDHGVTLANLSPDTLAQLDAVLPAHWSHGNPIDIIGDASPQRLAAALTPLLADPSVDGVLTLFCPQIVMTSEDAAHALRPLAQASSKPVLTGWLGETGVVAGRALIEAAGLPAFDSPEAGVIAFAALAQYTRAQELLLQVPAPLALPAAPDLDTPGVAPPGMGKPDASTRDLAAPGVATPNVAAPDVATPYVAAACALARTTAASGRTLLTEPESKQLLGWFGIATPRTLVAATLVEAIRIGGELGYPLALKILSPDIAHKSDVQGVTLNVRDLPSLEREFRNLMARTAKLRPDAKIDGVAIQPMIEKRFGREIMIGVARDAVFGQVISFGAGGVAVELLRDHAIGLPPLNRRLAEDLIERTRIARLLAAYRHIPAASHEAIIDVLLRVSGMVCALPWLQEMDINPLTVDDTGAVALDARVVIDPARLDEDVRYSHLAIHPYPTRLESSASLRDGSVINIRPIRPEDARMELAFVEGLSEQSRYMRFFNPARSLPARMLARFTQVDYERELALIALPGEPTGAGVTRMIGVARYTPDADGTSCEFAVTVADDWHNRGLATLLMQRLIAAAREAGYQRMTGTVLVVNTAMRSLMQALGFSARATPHDASVLDYTLDLE